MGAHSLGEIAGGEGGLEIHHVLYLYTEGIVWVPVQHPHLEDPSWCCHLGEGDWQIVAFGLPTPSICQRRSVERQLHIKECEVL